MHAHAQQLHCNLLVHASRFHTLWKRMLSKLWLCTILGQLCAHDEHVHENAWYAIGELACALARACSVFYSEAHMLHTRCT